MRYILGILGFIVLTVVAIILLANLGGNPDRQEGEKVVTLTDYIDDGATVAYTKQGELVGDDEFRAVHITVTPQERRIELFGGYNETVIKQETFANTQAGYDVFLHALSVAGFTREKTSQQEDIKGACPLGQRHIYELVNGGDQVTYLWSTTCGKREGTFGGDKNKVQQLFENQIPTYNKFVSGVEF